MMSDLIDRQQAIDAVCSICGNDCDKSKFVYNAPQDEQVIMCPEHYVLSTLPPAQPEPCEDAVSRKAVIDTIDEWNEACADSGHKETVSDIMLIRKDFIDLPPVTPKQPEQRTGALKAEIRRMKRSFTTCINSDYYTGYMSALSAVEGCIAQWEGVAE